MQLKTKHWIYGLFCLLVIVLALGIHAHHEQQIRQQKTTVAQSSTSSKQTHKKTNTQKELATSSHMRTPINWHKSSETVPYPDLNKVKNLWIKVDLKGNRTYLYDGKKVIYTMYSTGGMYKKDSKTGKMKSMTPTGTYHIQQERGDSFYNAQLHEGANYYVSWLHHGEYLFHSVPTVANGSYNKTEAAKLGKTQGSHGCIRLSIPDAKWMSTNIPVGTKVKIVG